MNIEDLKKEFLTTDFITTFIVIFIILFILTSFIKFLGSIPMLVIISFLLSYYIIKKGTNFKSISNFMNKKKNE